MGFLNFTVLVVAILALWGAQQLTKNRSVIPEHLLRHPVQYTKNLISEAHGEELKGMFMFFQLMKAVALIFMDVDVKINAGANNFPLLLSNYTITLQYTNCTILFFSSKPCSCFQSSKIQYATQHNTTQHYIMK
jgi:hypothetical protein